MKAEVESLRIKNERNKKKYTVIGRKNGLINTLDMALSHLLADIIPEA